MIRVQASMISKIGRATQGVRIMRLKNDGKVAAMALTPHEEDAEYDEIAPDATEAAAPVDAPVANDATEADAPKQEE